MSYSTGEAIAIAVGGGAVSFAVLLVLARFILHFTSDLKELIRTRKIVSKSNEMHIERYLQTKDGLHPSHATLPYRLQPFQLPQASSNVKGVSKWGGVREPGTPEIATPETLLPHEF